MQRWGTGIDREFFRQAGCSSLTFLFLKTFVAPVFRKMAYSQGMGRHTKEEILHIARRDLTALSDFIGESLGTLGKSDRPLRRDELHGLGLQYVCAPSKTFHASLCHK